MGTNINQVLDSGLRLSNPSDAEETYETVVNDCMRLAHGAFGSIFILNNEVLERVYASSPVLYTTRVRKKGFTYTAAHTLKPSFISIAKLRPIQPHLHTKGVKSVVFIPLINKNKAFGVISIDSTTKVEYTDKELELLALYGAFASLAIKRVELFNETKQALEIRDFFISIASHELRTPLTAINGYVQLLNKKIVDKESTEARWIEKLVQETNRMTILIKELLEVNRIRAGVAEYTLKEYSLNDIISRTINRILYHYQNREIIFDSKLAEGSDCIIADYDKLVQVFYNLIDNAIKYSHQADPVTVTIQLKKPNFVIKIVDKGKGITHDKVKEVLEGSIQQLDDGTEKAGIGLGLFLVKNIVQKHNGEIDIKTRKHKGTTVIVTLPKFDKHE
jgi:K+-sensing histidine kinase KdpD